MAAARRCLTVLALFACFAQGRRVGEQHRAAPGRRFGAAALAAIAAVRTAAAQEESLLRKFDRDGDGLVDRQEYMNKIAEVFDTAADRSEDIRDTINDHYRRVFAEADVNGDGRLNEAEMEYTSYISGEAAAEVPGDGASTAQDYSTASSRRLLENMDADGDGFVDREEFAALARQGLETRGWSGGRDPEVEAWIDELFDRADVGGEGRLGRKGVQLVSYLHNRDVFMGRFADRALAGMLLKELDGNGDGRIDAAEVAGAVLSAGGSGVGIMSAVSELFPWADGDGDGSLDLGEAVELTKALIERGDI